MRSGIIERRMGCGEKDEGTIIIASVFLATAQWARVTNGTDFAVGEVQLFFFV